MTFSLANYILFILHNLEKRAKKLKKALTVITLLISAQVNAYNGGLQATFSPELDSNELENKVKYEYLKSEYETKQTYAAALTKCANKNKYYLPGNGGSDSDGCFDVLGYLNNMGLSGTEVSYTGGNNLTSVTNALAISESAGHNRGVFSADVMCSTAYPNTRAMRAGDIKYLEKDNSVPSLNGIFLFEAFDGINDTTNSYYGYDRWNIAITNGESSPTCNGYNSSSSNLSSPRLNTSAGGVNGYTAPSGCASAGTIVCVRD